MKLLVLIEKKVLLEHYLEINFYFYFKKDVMISLENVHLVEAEGGVKKPFPSFPTDLDDSTPSSFCKFWRMDMVQSMYKKRNEQSV